MWERAGLAVGCADDRSPLSPFCPLREAWAPADALRGARGSTRKQCT